MKDKKPWHSAIKCTYFDKNDVDSTILLSTARSGTTFLGRKINGMCGMTESWTLNNEIVFEKFFVQNAIECLLHYSNTSLTWEQMERQNKVAISDLILNVYDIFQKDYKTSGRGKNPFFYLDTNTFETLIKRIKPAVFNMHLVHILYKIDFIKTIKTPIIYFIRKNNWSRAISEQVMQKGFLPSHQRAEENNFAVDMILDKQSLIQECENQIPMIKTFQRELKGQDNVKILYYEDIENPEYWTDQFIDELENFMGRKFVDRKYNPPLTKSRNRRNIINKDEIMDEELIKKYYINEI